ncbi:response regulator [Apibacter adventoris]|uniref:Response regulatory domain-containing protein n=1 Tax=Apibacter adventoris TaxID=1679466 RepID=A0A2S8A8A9_9FLAO|nr:response regulator transcription factor [Apibacter adventoris]PQL90760.1 hypothetical protein C4S77_09900 [Apibacter adventoris]
MFNKILIVEDFESLFKAIKIIAKELLYTPIIDQAFDYEEARIKIQTAKANQVPYDLLIIGLSFPPIDKEQKLIEKKELIKALKKEQPSLKIIVLSTDSKYCAEKLLQDNFPIDAVITDGKDNMKELKTAITEIYKGNTYISKTEQESYANKITAKDVELVRLLTSKKIKEISVIFKTQNIKACSISSINQRIKYLKETVHAKSIGELIIIFSQLGFLK